MRIQNSGSPFCIYFTAPQTESQTFFKKSSQHKSYTIKFAVWSTGWAYTLTWPALLLWRDWHRPFMFSTLSARLPIVPLSHSEGLVFLWGHQFFLSPHPVLKVEASLSENTRDNLMIFFNIVTIIQPLQWHFRVLLSSSQKMFHTLEYPCPFLPVLSFYPSLQPTSSLSSAPSASLMK